MKNIIGNQRGHGEYGSMLVLMYLFFAFLICVEGGAILLGMYLGRCASRSFGYGPHVFWGLAIVVWLFAAAWAFYWIKNLF